ncbi:hypothetical protein RYA05_02010 [Pseudomonas syringae pv. actinidiae]|nr:hypothetical protein [Pseudomonas syringae pv. actinidiae]
MNLAWMGTTLAVFTGVVISYAVGKLIPGKTEKGRCIGGAITMIPVGLVMCSFFMYSISFFVDTCAGFNLCAHSDDLPNLYYTLPMFLLPGYMAMCAYSAYTGKEYGTSIDPIDLSDLSGPHLSDIFDVFD